ncbi:hypothetical protein [Maricaulis parjimensis]|uniref:hypothetical protein n=1 Tax=Maricaulis parjimensis TaxID=144023 RepID=UPI00193A0717|nr:hypothetical protein [Maricaulis parjimensis]
MGTRLIMLIIATLVALAGLTASAWSLSRGETDQAIAFGWPSLAVIMVLALFIPARKARLQAVRGEKNGA